jgi:hypothetical protein
MGKPSKDKLFIGWLARQFEERRSDVTDVCDAFAKNREIPAGFEFEKRFVKAKIPDTGIVVEYDTLTTEIAYSTDGGHFQQCVEHEYKDE